MRWIRMSSEMSIYTFLELLDQVFQMIEDFSLFILFFLSRYFLLFIFILFFDLVHNQGSFTMALGSLGILMTWCPSQGFLCNNTRVLFDSFSLLMVTCAIPSSIITIIMKIFFIHDVDTSLTSCPCHFPAHWVKRICHPTRGGQALEECPQSILLEDKEQEEVTSSTQSFLVIWVTLSQTKSVHIHRIKPWQSHALFSYT